MEFQNKKILVAGAGISGIAAISLLMDENARLILFDGNQEINRKELKQKLPVHFDGEIIIGDIKEEIMEELSLAILSPGVPIDLPFVLKLREKKIPIWGEIELAYHFSKGRIAAITGTNGKTTTTALTGEIFKTYCESVFVVGNIGIPYTQMVKKTKEDSITVAEISSFQLETIETFRPDASAILNISPDHLNRHHTMEKYIEAKRNIAKNQTGDQTCVLNYEDLTLRKIGKELLTNVLWFSSARKLSKGLYLDNDLILYHNGDTKKEAQIICNIRELNIIGKHNYENVMAAAGLSIALGIPMEYIHKGVTSFLAVEHRIEYVTTKHGVKYYNDSKGTNPDAAIQAIRAMQTKTLLIAGGYDKGSEYKEWIQAFDNKVQYLVLLGQTSEKIAKTARSLGFQNIILVEDLKEAVDFCATNAKEGESVLLSPCCASWGMFKNYEERGQIFKEFVHAIL